ncbi:YkgJ family cysteine cluster protein [Helicobacter pylori]|uniref:YkgJ family cysteine cluster protein n=1 Tax=Helicobacter pylori TaxID=210 RepID=UPI001FD422BD|nr:YkgJ family cysteine cluster protein [Helicobacter pylori]UOR79943.1 YkgJ family cysteine cluster protein [Helicobacter pylori]
MKGSNEKLDRFPCTSCGLCCKNITGIVELVEFDVGNVVCKFLDSGTNLCKIYQSRPLICRVDEAHKKLYSHILLKEFYAKNTEVCNALQEANHLDKSFRVIIQ